MRTRVRRGRISQEWLARYAIVWEMAGNSRGLTVLVMRFTPNEHGRPAFHSSVMAELPSVNYCYIENSTSGFVALQQDVDLSTLRMEVRKAAAERLKDRWGIDGDSAIHPAPESVVIFSGMSSQHADEEFLPFCHSTDTHGFVSCQDDKKLASNVCNKSIITLIPSILQKDSGLPSLLAAFVPFELGDPLLDRGRRPSQPEPIGENHPLLTGIIQRLQGLEHTTTKLTEDNNNIRRVNDNLQRQVTDLTNQLSQEQAARGNIAKQLARLASENQCIHRQLDELQEAQQEHAAWIHSKII